MHIIQLSDLHMNTDKEKFETKRNDFNKIIEAIDNITNDDDERILIIICGDIVDHKDSLKDDEYQSEYRFARELLDALKRKLNEKDVLFAICPGNHDLINNTLTLFYSFVKYYCEAGNSNCPYLLSLPEEKTDFIVVNSVNEDDYTRGGIDYVKLEEILKQSSFENRFLIMHHTLLSMDERDVSSIVNASRLINLIDSYRVKAIFHGHTHGIDGTYIGRSNCLLMGVGAIFSENYPNVNSQFNYFHLANEKIDAAKNYRYNRDVEALGNNAFTTLNLLDLFGTQQNCFEEELFSLSYAKMISELRFARGPLYNVTIKGNYSYDSFVNDLKIHFLHENELGYTYEELAKMWEKTVCPDELYFNHGEKFAVNGEHGISHIIEHLKNKPTSNRAVLSSISTQDIIGKSDDDMLPSFMSIQFGFDRINMNTLYVSVNFRALEASRFLKINICEVYYLISQIHKCPVLKFDQVELSIHAFRVQIHENFRCFLKSKIDKLTSADLVMLIISKEYEQLAELLKDKQCYSESIIIKTGMVQFKYALSALRTRESDLTDKILEDVIAILDTYDALIAEGEKNSVRTELKTSLYKKINLHFDKIINVISNIKKGN